MYESHRGRVLFVDDDPELVKLFSLAFHSAGYELESAGDGFEAIKVFHVQQPDIVIVDLMMPRMNGWQVCQHVRMVSDVPVIILSAMRADDIMFRSLDVGAVDFVAKPVSLKLLLARVDAALRHAGQAPTSAEPQYGDGYLGIDLTQQHVYIENQPVELTVAEYRLLAYLYRNADRTVPAHEISDYLWGWQRQGYQDHVSLFMSRLRRKLEKDPRQPRYLLSKTGTGYQFQKQGPGMQP